jgi:hypothetical protein
MPGEHPFQQLFETFGKLPAAHSDTVNRKARETLKNRLTVSGDESGHCILLKAPRAGHGKTHLLTRLQHDLAGSHEFIPLQAVGGSRIDAVTVLEDTMRRLVRPLPAAGGLTVLDLLTRRLFAQALQPLVNSGEVPCQDREGALTALRNRPIETFDFHHPGAVTAHWARENFELLGPRLALGLSQSSGLPLREVSFWVETMFRFAATQIDNPGRVRALAASVFDEPSAESTSHERLVALLGLMGSMMRVVLVADELEGFSSDEAAALRFASFIGSVRQSLEKVDVILSVNEDVWQSAFLPRLSGGLADRLSEITIELEPLDRDGMLATIESRSPGMGKQILGNMQGSPPTYARGIVKNAAAVWGLGPKAEVAAAEEITAVFVPPVSEPEPPAPAFSVPAPAEIPVSEPQPDPPAIAMAEDSFDTPTNFSPEAAIAAFGGSFSHSETLPAPQFEVPPVSQPFGGVQPVSVDSPFRIDVEAESAMQAFQVDPPPVETEQPATDESASTDRVDSLLKQFRERYGKP